jgi:arylsulfatase A-like enzyme
VGQKNSLWEGGIRVPAIVRWPGGGVSNVQSPRSKVIADTRHPTPDTRFPGRIIHDPCITMDWTATILAAAEAKPDPKYPLDGIDLLPLLRKANTRNLVPDTHQRTFFWRNANQDAAVRGPWKYLNDGTREYLFNLSIDQREQADFRNQNPALFNELRKAFKTWESTVLPRPPARTNKA